MQPLLLDSNTSDELLLERLNIACANETERRNKKKFSTPQPATTVSAVQSEEPYPAKCPVKEAKAKLPPELLTELAELKTGVASLKGLSAEIAQIKETSQHPMFQSQPGGSPPAGRLGRDLQPPMYPQQYHSQPQAPTPLQPQQGHHPYTNRPTYIPRRCFAYQQTGAEGRCMHCYRCGSGEHFQAGCKIRGVRPSREAPLNGRRLTLRDEC